MDRQNIRYSRNMVRDKNDIKLAILKGRKSELLFIRNSGNYYRHTFGTRRWKRRLARHLAHRGLQCRSDTGKRNKPAVFRIFRLRRLYLSSQKAEDRPEAFVFSIII